jgi:hypothetical protein
MRSLRPAVCLLVLALWAAAATAYGASNPGDAAIAGRVAFRASDFPSSWSATPPGKDTGCFTGPAKKLAATGFAASQRFASGDGGTVASEFIVVYRDVASARRGFDTVTAPAPFACYRAKLTGLMAASGFTLDSFARAPLAFAALGGVVRTYRAIAVIGKGGQSDRLYLDYIAVVRGRVLVSAGFVRQSRAPEVRIEHAVLAKVAARM